MTGSGDDKGEGRGRRGWLSSIALFAPNSLLISFESPGEGSGKAETDRTIMWCVEGC